MTGTIPLLDVSNMRKLISCRINYLMESNYKLQHITLYQEFSKFETGAQAQYNVPDVSSEEPMH